MADSLKSRDPRELVSKLAEKKFQCSVCNKTYTTPYAARRHVEAVHQEKKLICCQVDGCQEHFSNYSTAKRHSLRDHKDNAFDCPDGICIFRSIDFLR